MGARDGEFWQRRISDGQLNNWRGHAFERVCLDHIPQLKRALGISGVSAEVYSLRMMGNSSVSGAEIDLVLDRKDNIVNLCEMKYVSEGSE